MGYASGKAIRCDDLPNCDVSRKRKGRRPTLGFAHGDCVLLDWRQVEQAAAPARRRKRTVA